MDPKKLSQLDPKLREAYERVMGTTIPNLQVATDQKQTPLPAVALAEAGTPINEPITPISNPTPQPQPQPTPVVPQPITEPQPAINPQPEAIPTQQASNFVQMNSEVLAAPTPTATSNPNFVTPIQTPIIAIKKNNLLIPILFGIVGLVFIVIYTLFWTKIFNFKLPFLP